MLKIIALTKGVLKSTLPEVTSCTESLMTDFAVTGGQRLTNYCYTSTI